MKPKEKAEQLLEIYVDVNEFYNNTYNNKVVVRDYNFAKQCALIAVDELIKETSFEVPNIRQTYWYYVKQEINKL